MNYLLDVNALMALGVLQHVFHQRMGNWIKAVAREPSWELVTCSLTELGFVRVLAQTPQFGLTVAQSKDLLLGLKVTPGFNFRFIADDHDISKLPSWVAQPKQTTDGHLLELARSNGSLLATLDRGIPGALLIPPEQ